MDKNKKPHSFIVEKWDAGNDIAVLASSTFEFTDGLQLGSYDSVEEGDDIYLCGFPLGSQYHVTHRGMVSAKGIIQGRNALQIEASINRGNSGGPCCIDSGRKIPIVVGMVATRLVDIELGKANKMLEKLRKITADPKTESDIYADTVKKSNIRELLRLDLLDYEIFVPILEQVNRYTNVGLGEAVAMEDVSDWLRYTYPGA